MGFNDDFFFTGGGFSDWSGKSVGKFASSSKVHFSGGGRSGIPDDYKSGLEPLLNEERKIGLPLSALNLPRFMNGDEWAKKIFQLMLIVGLEVFASYMYIERPCYEYLDWSLPVYVVATFLLFAYLIDTPDWYPGLSKELTLRVVRGFYKRVKVLQIVCSTIGLAFALTPLFCSISEHEVPNGWAIAVIAIDVFFASMLLYAAFKGDDIDGMARDRIPYIFYKAEILDKEQQTFVQELGEKQLLLLNLCREKKDTAETKKLVEEINKMKVTFLKLIKK